MPEMRTLIVSVREKSKPELESKPVAFLRFVENTTNRSLKNWWRAQDSQGKYPANPGAGEPCFFPLRAGGSAHPWQERKKERLFFSGWWYDRIRIYLQFDFRFSGFYSAPEAWPFIIFPCLFCLFCFALSSFTSFSGLFFAGSGLFLSFSLKLLYCTFSSAYSSFLVVSGLFWLCLRSNLRGSGKIPAWIHLEFFSEPLRLPLRQERCRFIIFRDLGIIPAWIHLELFLRTLQIMNRQERKNVLE